MLVSSCTANAQQESKWVIEIDASYMKEHIYDFDAHPNEFVYKGEKPAIIDFYADWCGPCRALGPKLIKAAEEHQGEVIVYKVNVDKNKELAAHFGVQSIPTILFVPVEGTPYLSQGNLPSKSINEMLQKIMPN